MMNLAKVKKFAQKFGYDGAKYRGEWKQYEVYEPTLENEEPADIGKPEFILVLDDTIRMATEDEAFEYIDTLPDDYEDDEDEIPEQPVAKTFSEILKFNPYHDSRGRFTSANGYASFTVRTKDPKKQHMADMAVAREKDRHKKQQEEQEKPRTITLNQKYKDMANNWTFMRDKGAYVEREANKQLDAFREEFKRDDYTDEQKAYLKQRENEYADLLTEKYNDQLYREGTNPSAMIAGPAKFDHRKYERKFEAEMRSQEEYRNKQQKFVENTKKQLERMEPEEKQIARWRQGKWSRGESISSDDPLAEKKLQAKLDYHVEQQQKMKDANAYYRKNGSMQGFTGFNDATNRQIDAQMQDYKERGWNYLTTQPFQSATLTNNNATIKATRDRLTQFQNRKQTAAKPGGTGPTKFEGGQLVRNTDINRLQIKFDSIPDAATRQKLKSSGWRWSPKEGAWQRQLTENAERSANSILGITKSAAKGGADMSRYDHIVEVGIAKDFDDLIEVAKFNPYHDAKGRFTSGGSAASFTYSPGRSKAHDKAIAREKEKAYAVGPNGINPITSSLYNKTNVDKNEEKIRGQLGTDYDPIEKQSTNLKKVMERGGCTEAQAKECEKLSDAVFEKAKAEEPQITSDIVSVVKDNAGTMFGLAYRMKQNTSMAGKIAADSKEDGKSFEECAAGIKDAIRYTAVFETASFTAGYKNVKQSLLSQGYEEVRCKNFYKMYEAGTSCQKAVQCVYKNKSGQMFELQFHTPRSLGAKEINHPLYEEQRAKTTSKGRAAALNDAMTKIGANVPNPAGVMDI